MLKEKLKLPMNIVCIGDVYVSADTMEDAIKESNIPYKKITKLFWGSKDRDVYAKEFLNIERNGADAQPPAEGLEEACKDADLIFTHVGPIPKRIIDSAKNLKIILTSRAGCEQIDVKAASEKNIPVLNVIRNAEPVADFVLGLMIALTRNIVLSNRKILEGRWDKSFYNSDFSMTLNSYLVGLIGVGNVGTALAKRLEALGVNVIAYDEYTTENKLRKAGLKNIKLVDSLDELYEKSDILSLHLRLTEETKETINKTCFEKMKNTAYFINSARGGLVNNDDLINALEKKQIAGAAIDVFENEPLEEDSKLRNMENVILTTHIAGTTVDAVPKSPYLTIKEFDNWLKNDITNRIVNLKDIKL